MSTPDNPYGAPEQNPPPPPGPQYGQPPAYGSPLYGAPQGQPAPYGAPFGQPPYAAGGQGSYGGQLVEWPIRVASSLIDSIVPVILWVIARASGSAGIYSLLSLLSLGFWLWNMIRQGRTGQSIGKSVMGTYVIRESDGQYIGGGLGIVRYLAHIVDFLSCMIGFLWPIWDAKKQTFADKIMGTLVVRR